MYGTTVTLVIKIVTGLIEKEMGPTQAHFYRNYSPPCIYIPFKMGTFKIYNHGNNLKTSIAEISLIDARFLKSIQVGNTIKFYLSVLTADYARRQDTRAVPQ